MEEKQYIDEFQRILKIVKTKVLRARTHSRLEIQSRIAILGARCIEAISCEERPSLSRLLGHACPFREKLHGSIQLDRIQWRRRDSRLFKQVGLGRPYGWSLRFYLWVSHRNGWVTRKMVDLISKECMQVKYNAKMNTEKRKKPQ